MNFTLTRSNARERVRISRGIKRKSVVFVFVYVGTAVLFSICVEIFGAWWIV